MNLAFRCACCRGYRAYLIWYGETRGWICEACFRLLADDAEIDLYEIGRWFDAEVDRLAEVMKR